MIQRLRKLWHQWRGYHDIHSLPSIDLPNLRLLQQCACGEEREITITAQQAHSTIIQYPATWPARKAS